MHVQKHVHIFYQFHEWLFTAFCKVIYNDDSLNTSFIFKGNTSSKAGYNMAALHVRIALDSESYI